MARSGRPPDRRAQRRRLIAGGATGFAVAFAFVAANAIWYQPHAHRSPIMVTRAVPEEAAPVAESPPDEQVTTIIRLERETPEPQGDPEIRDVQRVMTGLGLYGGSVDGIAGPLTRAAIRSYQEKLGLPATGEIDAELLAKLGLGGAPAPAPASRGGPPQDAVQTASVAPSHDATVMRVQAALKAFGNDGLAIDGVMGPRTSAAILEFQSLFGLPETGEPDAATYAKMREIGLAD